MTLGISAGPTLNVVSTTLNHQGTWVSEGGLAVKGESTHTDQTNFAVGAGVEATARHNLSSDGRVFIEAHAGYKWLNEIAIKGSTSSARLDLSDWDVGLGVGLRLGDWPAGSPWSVRVGVDARNLSLRLGPASAGQMKSLFDHRHKAAGFFNGVDTIHYDDGTIYGHGTADTDENRDVSTINDFSQAHLGEEEYFPIGVFIIGDIYFHSRNYQETLKSVSGTGLSGDDDLAMPFIELSRVLVEGGPLAIGATFGWSASDSSVGLGPALSGVATTRRTGTAFRYRYPVSNPLLVGVDVPTESSTYPYTGKLLAADPRNFYPGDHQGRPSRSGRPFTDPAHYFAFSSANVEVSMQTLSFASDITWKPLKHLELGFSAGPTLNVVSTSTDLATDWVR